MPLTDQIPIVKFQPIKFERCLSSFNTDAPRHIMHWHYLISPNAGRIATSQSYLRGLCSAVSFALNLFCIPPVLLFSNVSFLLFGIFCIFA